MQLQASMRYYPAYDEFVELARGKNLVPVFRQLVGDTLTPVSAFCKIQEGDWAFLFESVVGGERLGRYSFLGSGPFLQFQALGSRVVMRSRAGGQSSEGGRTSAGLTRLEEIDHADPLKLLEEKLNLYRTPNVPGLPRFCGGAVGYAA
jgi:anthranilate synthase component 1